MPLDAISISCWPKGDGSRLPEGWERTPQGSVLSSLTSRLGGTETDGTIRVTVSADRGIGINILRSFTMDQTQRSGPMRTSSRRLLRP